MAAPAAPSTPLPQAIIEAAPPPAAASNDDLNRLRQTIGDFLNAWYVRADYRELENFIAQDNIFNQPAGDAAVRWKTYLESFLQPGTERPKSITDAISYRDMSLPKGSQPLQYMNRGAGGKLLDPFAILDPMSGPPGAFFPRSGLLPIPCALEIVPVHLILKHWSPVGAWITTGLSLYGMIWLIGLARAFALRPLLVGRDYLDVRYGLAFRLRMPREMIACVRPALANDAVFAVPRGTHPNTCIELVEPMNAEGAFGIRKRVNRVAVTADDENSLALALRELMNTK